MTELWRMGASELVGLVKSREVSVREAVSSVLDRLEQVDPAINAVPEVHAEAAMERAAQLDAALSSGARPGSTSEGAAPDETGGELLGVPVTVKPNVDMAGSVTHAGCTCLHHVAREDSIAVAGLRQAGAVIIGRTNMPEMSMRWTSDGPLYGPTVNPWNPAVVPGGSTGGGAAAVATGIGPIAHGNDLGGSLRQPAACCGVVALRPTAGRLPYRVNDSYPSLDSQLMGVDGPIARTVEDAWLGLAAMAGASAAEPLHAPVPLRAPNPDTSLRVAVVVDPDGGGVDPEVASAVTAAAAALEGAGHRIVEVRVPAVGPLASIRNDIVWAKVRFAFDDIRDQCSEAINGVWDNMAVATNDVDLAGYLSLLTARAEHMREWDLLFREVDVILGPVSTEPPFEVGADTSGYERFAEMLHALRFTLGTVLTGLPVAAVPAGLDSAGSPLGVQLVAPRWREDLAAVAAAAVERELGLPTPIDPVGRAA